MKLIAKLLILSLASVTTRAVVRIFTRDNQECVNGFASTANGTKLTLSQCVFSAAQHCPWCATSLTDNKTTVKTWGDCVKMTGCDKETERFHTCAAFTYKGVSYDKGECTYLDDIHPWCAINTNETSARVEFRRRELGKDWDFCSPQCVLQ